MKKVFILILILFPITIYAQVDFNWVNPIGGSTFDEGFSVTTDDSGNVYTCGYFRNTADFDPGPGIYNLTSFGGRDGFICKYNSNGNFVWASRFGSNIDGDEARSIHVDANGFVYVTGEFHGNVDFDPGPGNTTLSSVGNDDVFVSKFNVNGSFIWAKKWGGIGFDIGNCVRSDNAGNIYITGFYSYTVDFNPGASAFNMTSAGSYDVFISKLDASGNFIWAKGIGDTNPDEGRFLGVDNSNNVYVTGKFYNTVDFNPGAGIFNLTSAGSSDVFFLKLDPTGNFVFAGKIGGTSFDRSESIIIKNNSLYLVGGFIGTVDFDPGVGVSNMTAPDEDGFVISLTASGNFNWVKVFNCTGHLECNSLYVDSASNLYIGGSFQASADFDPGIDTLNLTSSGDWDMFVSKLDSLGNFDWAVKVGGVGYDFLHETALGINNSIYSTGMFTGLVDFDPGQDTSNLTSLGSYDAFVLKLHEHEECAQILLSIDSIENVLCNDTGVVIVSAINGTFPYAYSWNTLPIINDSILHFSENGIYTLTVLDSNQCSNQFSFLINTPITSTGFDLNANLVPGSFIPNTSSQLWIDGLNSTCTPINGVLSLKLDTNVTFNSSSPAPDNISGDTLFWNFTNLTADSQHLTPVISFTTSAIANIGDSLFFDLSITPSIGDFDTLNNSKEYIFIVQNTSASCQKNNYPLGECAAGYLLPNQTITYSILFQNAGPDSSNSVFILDTLDTDLDLHSVVVVGSSHSMIIEIVDSAVLKFRFDNINLPDSITNEPASYGYVIFEVLNDSILANNTAITNKANVFFDLNPVAVSTNIVTNTIVDTIPQSNSIINISSCNSALINGYSYDSTGTYIQYLDNYLGCDSIITLNLSIIDSSSSIIVATNCDSYTCNSITYTSSGLYNQVIPNSVGCDSNITLNLTILDSTINTINATTCNQYNLNSFTYNNSGTYFQTLTNNVGCDSLIVLNLIILDSSSTTISATACNNYILNSNNYSSSGMYYQTIPNSMGCDSLITLNLTILDSTANIITTSSCGNFTLNSITYNTSGIYHQTLTNSVGCDSAITLNLTVNNIDNSFTQTGNTLTATQNGASYQWIDCNNSNLPISGQTNQTFTATSNGSYAVIISTNGCSDTSACQAIFGFGLENIDFANGLTLSPNPTNSIVTISSLLDLKDATIQVTNIDGQVLVSKNNVSAKTISLDLIELRTGMYFINVASEGKTAILKVVKN